MSAIQSWAETCLRCAGPMVEGYLLDGTDSGFRVGQWVEGPPQKTWLGLKTKGRGKYPVVAYRCETCGRLELYATEDG